MHHQCYIYGWGGSFILTLYSNQFRGKKVHSITLVQPKLLCLFSHLKNNSTRCFNLKKNLISIGPSPLHLSKCKELVLCKLSSEAKKKKYFEQYMIFSLHFPQITDVIKSISQDFQDPKKASISIMTYFFQHTPYHIRNCMLYGHLSSHLFRLFSPTSTIIYFRTVEGETSLQQHNFGHNIFLTVHTPFHLHKDNVNQYHCQLAVTLH